MYDPYAEFTKTVLPNGLEIHSRPCHGPQWIKARIVVHSGAREDPTGMPGLAHFVEHMVSNNIPNRKFDDAKEFFEARGGHAEFGYIDYLAAEYAFSIPADPVVLQEALQIFGSMLLEANLVKEIEKERNIIACEFNRCYPILKDLEWLMERRKAVFSGHRLETWNRPIGRPEGFMAAMKEDLQGYYDKHYVPANMSIVITGALTDEQIVAELEKSPFGMKKDGSRNQIPKPFRNFKIPEEPNLTVRLSDYSTLKTEQTSFKLTWGFPSDFPIAAGSIFRRVLSAILMDEIREKRELTYSVGVNFDEFQDVSQLQINGQVSPSATPIIKDLVLECISKAPLRHDLFEKKLNSAIQKNRMIDLSGVGLVNIATNELAKVHRIITMQEDLDGLHKVKFEQMAEFASLLRTEHVHSFIQQP